MGGRVLCLYEHSAGLFNSLLTVTMAEQEPEPEVLEMVSLYTPASPSLALWIIRVLTPVFSERERPGLETRGMLSFSHTETVCGAQEMKHFSSTVSPSSTSLLEKEEKISGAWMNFRLNGAIIMSDSSVFEVLEGDLSSGPWLRLEGVGVPLGVARGVGLGVTLGVSPSGEGRGVRRGVPPTGVFRQDIIGVTESNMGQLHRARTSSLSFCSGSKAGSEKS